ncbi:universal stress protein [Methylobacterium sp. J-078]|jgi:nucleotide-binding universal stress UspA family protein|uniref:universal stress protein n=1 Tax=Methylobacterium sp. J-078 TaxID=2836657 RepID=UPI001FBAC11D|nr:universal stress protein [Methylobacterium sp. J-078]MCJ2042952.1 universal stress protein [Methylobacterium sp. J-078]
MNVASIMVSVDLGPAAADRVQLASSLAGRFDAELIGVAARQVTPPPHSTSVYAALQVTDVEVANAGRDLEQARAIFDRNVEGLTRTGWRSDLADPSTYLAGQARAADVVVVGRWGARDPEPGPMGVLPGPFVVEAGRPVLVAPPGIETLRSGRVVVAWKDTLEARRAVLHALPFLERSERVLVIGVGGETDTQGLDDVAAYLSRHGLEVTTHREVVDDAGTGEAILRFVAREDADLLVMGAYGHSRLREWMFGGVTRDILRNAPVCCLMSN